MTRINDGEGTASAVPAPVELVAVPYFLFAAYCQHPKGSPTPKVCGSEAATLLTPLTVLTVLRSPLVELADGDDEDCAMVKDFIARHRVLDVSEKVVACEHMMFGSKSVFTEYVLESA